MKKSFYIFQFLILNFIVLAASAQNWENYSNVTQVTDAKTKGDHIWTSCKGGVVDFNATTGEKTIYLKGISGLPSASVEQVGLSSITDEIWVGTYDAGVVNWTGSNWIAYDFPSAFNLYRMKFDGFGDIWLQTDMGLYKFDCVSHDYTFINSIGGAGWDFNAWDFDITADNHVLVFTGTNCLVIDAATNTPIDSFPNSDSPIVLSCSPNTVRVYEVDADTYLINNSGFLEFEFKDGSFVDASSGLPAFAYINNISRGSDNTIYIFVNNTGIYKLVGFNWVFVQNVTTYSYEKLMYTDGTDFYLNRAIYMETPLLIKANSGGLIIYDPANYVFTSNDIKGVAMNDAGDIFMTSESNIYQYNAVNNNWDLYAVVPSSFGIYDLKFMNGLMYVVDYGNLIEYFDGTSWTHIPSAGPDASIYIFDYDVAPDGSIYYSSDDGLYQSKDGVTELLFPTYAVDTWILSMTYDVSRDLLWLGRLNGIVKYDFITQDLINSVDVPAMAEGASIQEIQIDAQNNVWFGANNNKAYMYDGTDWADYTLGASFDFIISIAFNQDKVYFGLTDGNGGVYAYNTTDESFMYYSTEDDASFVSNTVNYMLVDLDHNLWVAHKDAGISVLRAEVEPVAVQNIEVAKTLLVYPNPAINQVTINYNLGSDLLIQIVDASGKLVLKSTTKENTFDVSHLPNGIYLLSVLDVNTNQKYNSYFCISK